MASGELGVALITGASSGIGRGTALAFARAGCLKMLLGDINRQDLDYTREKVHKIAPAVEVELAHLDVSKEDSVQAFVDRCVSRFGRIDHACNIAGIVPPRKPVIDTAPEVFDRVVEVNAYGTFLCHRAELRQLLKQQPDTPSSRRGTIVSVSSLAGINASPGVSPYCSTKFAIIGLVKTDAQDYAEHGIRVNAVCPGFTDTEALLAMSTAEQRTALAETIPLRRLGLPEEVGKAIVFLSSDMSSYVNGTALVVDGGASIYRQAEL